MRTTIGLTLAAIVLCGAATPTPKNKPAAMPMGTGPVVMLGNRPAHCRSEASAVYGTKSSFVTTGRAKSTASGATIDGSVDKGKEGIKKFRCRFDTKGRFIDVMALTSDGE